MQHAKLIIALLAVFHVAAYAQTAEPAKPEKPSPAQTQKLLEQLRQKLGGEEKLKMVRSLSLTGKYRTPTRAGETSGELKIELLMPDKFMRTEKSNPQQLTFVTLVQSLDGNQAWADRQVSRASTDDGAISPNQDRLAVGTPVASGTAGMRATTTGQTSIRTTPPDRVVTTEQTALGMRLPTATEGHERDSALERIHDERKAAAQNKAAANRPPPVAPAQTALEKRLKREFAALSLVWLASTPESVPVNLQHAETINTGNGIVEAIEISGGEEFAARLFIDQRTMLPTMIGYRDFIKRGEGYVVSASADDPGELQEIAVQFAFADYRPVNGVLLPHLIVKAVNGAMVSEWKIEKYKLNPDLKPKRFEKK